MKHAVNQVHHEILPGTDVAIRIYLATPNRTFEKAMREFVRKAKQ